MEIEISLPGEQVMPIPKLGNKNKKNNKSKPNGFFCFAQAQKQKLSATHDIRGNSQLVALCDPLWRSMSAEEKKMWTQRAKEEHARAQAKVVATGPGVGGELRMDCNRQVISQRQASERAEQQRRESERQYCRQVLETCEEVPALEFYIVDSLTTIDYNDGVFVPCEVGVVRCNLRDGIIAQHHFFPDPGTLRHGHFHEALSKAEAEHEIAPVGFKLASRDYEKDASKLFDLMCLDRPMRPLVFSRSSEAKRSEGCFQWLHSRVEKNMKVDVMELEMWIMEMVSATSKAPHSLAQMRRFLYETRFDFAPGIRCDFHRSTDKTACAIGHAKKWFYFLIEIVFENYVFDVVEGKHYPNGTKFGVHMMQPTYYQQAPLPPRLQEPHQLQESLRQPPAQQGACAQEEPPRRPVPSSKSSSSSRGRGRNTSNYTSLSETSSFFHDSSDRASASPSVNSFMNMQQPSTAEPLPYSRGRGRARGLPTNSEMPRRPHCFGPKS